MKISINYPKEQTIRKLPNGVLLAAGQELWVNISDEECVVVGTGERVKFTYNCMAWPVSHIEVTV